MPRSRDDAMSRSRRHGVSERYAGCAVAYTGLWAGARIPPTELMEASTSKILTSLITSAPQTRPLALCRSAAEFDKPVGPVSGCPFLDTLCRGTSRLRHS